MPDRIEVTNNADALQYELHVDGEQVGLLRYTVDGDTVALVHTEVDPGHEGGGLGSRLVHDALADVRASGRTPRAVCPFVTAYLRRHPDDQ
jgi:predicted GNAT family acetyltransferase